MALTTIVWPDWMPKPQVNGYGIQPVDRRTKTDMEIGGVYRVEFDSDECICQCSLILNPDQSAWLEAFERDILKQGSVWFEIPLWVGGEIEIHVVRMRDRPSAGKIIGVYTTYMLSLDVKGRNLMSGEEMEALSEFSPAQIRIADDLLRRIVNVDMPGFDLLSFPLFPEINFKKECEAMIPSEDCVYE